MALIRCPTCLRQFDSRDTDVMPFCGERCQQIDLGAWLNEEFGFPFEPEDRLPADQMPDEE